MRWSSICKLVIVFVAGELTVSGTGLTAQPSLKLTCAMNGSCISEGTDENACKRFGVTNGDYLVSLSSEKQEAEITTPASVFIKLPIQCFNGVCKGRSNSGGVVRNLSLIKSTNQASLSETYFVSRRRYKLIKLYSGPCR